MGVDWLDELCWDVALWEEELLETEEDGVGELAYVEEDELVWGEDEL